MCVCVSGLHRCREIRIHLKLQDFFYIPILYIEDSSQRANSNAMQMLLLLRVGPDENVNYAYVVHDNRICSTGINS